MVHEVSEGETRGSEGEIETLFVKECLKVCVVSIMLQSRIIIGRYLVTRQ